MVSGEGWPGELIGSAELLDGLVVRPGSMRHNLDMPGGLIDREGVMMAPESYLGVAPEFVNRVTALNSGEMISEPA